MHHSFLIHSLTDGHLGSFQHLAIVNNTSMNIGVLMSFWLSVLVPLDIFPEVGLLAQKQIHIKFFEVSPYCFLQWLHQFAFSPTMQKGSPFSTSSPALVVCWFINDNHSDRCEMVSHCGFNLYFSDEYWRLAFFHMSIGHLHVLFGEGSIQVLCPCFNWIVCSLAVEFCKYFINFGY